MPPSRHAAFTAACADASCARRTALRSLVGGSLLLPGLLKQAAAAESSADPLAPHAPHFAPKAKRVIFLYMSGGVSQMDSFDPKPRLLADAGKASPENGRPYLRPMWGFSRDSACGTEVSDLFPHVRKRMDDICLVRSMRGDHNDHFQATMGIHTGSVTVTRPSLGSWVSYGLGTVNRNLPSFVVLAPKLPYCGPTAWSSDFLPAYHQGTRVLPGDEPVPNLRRRAPSAEVQEMELGLLERFNRRHLRTHAGAEQGDLSARLRSYETAFRMQMEMPDVLDLSKETDATLGLYGLPRGSTKGFAWQCLIARRLIEHGVRFVELIDTGSTRNWDAHSNMPSHAEHARNVDQPIAGLLQDLKSRGLLEDTLVVWSSEFGRSPFVDGPDGRSHQQTAFSAWLAGAGVKGGVVHGKTDDYARQVIEDPVHVHDFHATILHLLGFDHEKLTFRHAGRDFRLTDVAGRVVKPLLV